MGLGDRDDVVADRGDLRVEGFDVDRVVVAALELAVGENRLAREIAGVEDIRGAGEQTLGPRFPDETDAVEIEVLPIVRAHAHATNGIGRDVFHMGVHAVLEIEAMVLVDLEGDADDFADGRSFVGAISEALRKSAFEELGLGAIFEILEAGVVVKVSRTIGDVCLIFLVEVILGVTAGFLEGVTGIGLVREVITLVDFDVDVAVRGVLFDVIDDPRDGR